MLGHLGSLNKLINQWCIRRTVIFADRRAAEIPICLRSENYDETKYGLPDLRKAEGTL